MKFEIFTGVFLYYFVGINIFSFLVMGFDKLSAVSKRYRTSEKFLMILSTIGGSFGILTGMAIFRHKIRKKKFFLGVPFIIIVQLILAYLVVSYVGEIGK